MDFLKEIVKEIGDDFTQLASNIDETEKYVDTGSYIFNGLVSGSIFGGVSSNKITAIAGESSTGKTFFSLAVVKNFLESNPDSYCLYFDTEAAVNKSLLESRGLGDVYKRQTLVRTSLTDWFQVAYLVVYLGTRLLLLLVSLAPVSYTHLTLPTKA